MPRKDPMLGRRVKYQVWCMIFFANIYCQYVDEGLKIRGATEIMKFSNCRLLMKMGRRTFNMGRSCPGTRKGNNTISSLISARKFFLLFLGLLMFTLSETESQNPHTSRMATSAFQHQTLRTRQISSTLKVLISEHHANLLSARTSRTWSTPSQHPPTRPPPPPPPPRCGRAWMRCAASASTRPQTTLALGSSRR